MDPWQPANAFEGAVYEALQADDLTRIAAALHDTEIALPISAAAFAGEESARWPTFVVEGRTWITAYTSIEGMKAGTKGEFENARVATLPELAAGWPDPNWCLALNAGTPIQILLDPAALARIAAPSLLEDRDADPAARHPLMQKLLRPIDIQELLDGATRASGYCHQTADVAHIATPQVLIEALIAAPEQAYYLTAEGSVNILRWPAVGLEMYRSPYGGIDEESRAATDGWLIEEPPFVGLGFVPNPDQLIREYKIDGVGLPYGTEIWELTDGGVEHRRAVLLADLGKWHVITAENDVTAQNGAG